tara:strand:- start:5513 stop:6130 length:618 start_codon:yes stop_codon:yes gene_type:complete
MWYDKNISAYADINFAINKKYCEKYNIPIFKCNKRRVPTRAPSWEKIPLLLEYINNYDYVIWIDSDAYFYLDSTNILDIINENNNYDIIFSADPGVAINAGIYIVKNTKYSIEFLNKWQYDEELYKNNSVPYWWDNGVILDMLKVNCLDIKNHCKIIDYGILQHFYQDKPEKFTNKPLIFHLAGRSSRERYITSLDYYNTNIKNL